MSLRNKIHNLLAAIINGPKAKISVQVASVNYSGILKDRVILVIGASRGIGFSIAQKLVEEGANVIISGRSKASLEEAVSELGARATYVQYDNEDISNRLMFVKECYEKFERVDDIIFNAGVSLHEGDFLNVEPLGFEMQMRINLESTYFLAQSFIKEFLKDSRCKHNILFVSSETAGKSNDLPYGLSKVALTSMLGGFARRLVNKGIRINGIAPGVTVSSMTTDKKQLEDYCYSSASGRYLLPEEVANVAVFLISDASSCINGECIYCDFGNHLKINGFDNNYAL